MSATLEKALAMLARLRGTSVETEIEHFNANVAAQRARMRRPPALTEEERIARDKASRRRSLDTMIERRAAARALRPVPTAEEIAAKAAEKKARQKAFARRSRVKLRDKRREERAYRKACGFGALPLKSPTIAEAQARISQVLSSAFKSK